MAAPLTSADTVFHYTREPDPAWVAALAQLSPPSETTSHLTLVWEAGDPWEPGQRWVLYELYPLAATDPELLAQLRGPHPRTRGRYDQVLRTFVEDPGCLITATQWALYRRTGRYGVPFWVIQGAHGGHKRWFSRQEQRLLKLRGQPTDPPAIGDLPYAEPDARVWAQIRQHDRLQQVRDLFKARSADALTRATRDEEQAFRTAVVQWLETQVTDDARDYARAVPTDGVPRVETDFSREWDQTVERYITHGAA